MTLSAEDMKNFSHPMSSRMGGYTEVPTSSGGSEPTVPALLREIIERDQRCLPPRGWPNTADALNLWACMNTTVRELTHSLIAERGRTPEQVAEIANEILRIRRAREAAA